MLMLAAVVVFIVDLSGFTGTWKGWLGRWLKVSVGSCKPFDCSLCMTWWTCLVYLLCNGSFSLAGVALAGLAALLTPFIGELLTCLRELLRSLVRLLWTFNDKIQ